MAELRCVDVGFAKHLVGLWTTTFEEAYYAVHSEENIRTYCETNYTIDAAEAALSDPKVICKVVFRDVTALGFYLLKHNECPVPLSGRASELKQIYVLASEYGSGIGKLLFEDAIQCLQDAHMCW